jgi:hypothetical protein
MNNLLMPSSIVFVEPLSGKNIMSLANLFVITLPRAGREMLEVLPLKSLLDDAQWIGTPLD